MDLIETKKQENTLIILEEFEKILKTINEQRDLLLSELEEATTSSVALLNLQEMSAKQKSKTKTNYSICDPIVRFDNLTLLRLSASVRKIGNVLYPSPEHSTFTISIVNYTYVVNITTRTSNGTIYPQGGLKIIVRVVESDKTYSVKDNKNGTYQSVIKSTNKLTENTIEVMINYQHLQNSPCKCSPIKTVQSNVVSCDTSFGQIENYSRPFYLNPLDTTSIYIVSRTYTKQCTLHSFNDQPAVVYNNGSCAYYTNDSLDRKNGPASIYINENGKKHEYYKDGNRHREGGPAIIRYDLQDNILSEEYFINGQRHREDGPAFISNSDPHGQLRIWYMYNEIKRSDDGPTIIFPNGVHMWLKNDTIHRDNGPAIVHIQNDKIILEEYHVNGVRHRIDGPAVIQGANKRYYKDGLLHRDYGFACEYENGTRIRYHEGKIHSSYGPAITYADGSRFFYAEGRLYPNVPTDGTDTEAEHEYYLYSGLYAELADGTRKFLRYEQGDYIRKVEYPDGSQLRLFTVPNTRINKLCSDGTRLYHHYTPSHTDSVRCLDRYKMPAVEEISGIDRWYNAGSLNNKGNAAIMYPNGAQEWYKGGERREPGSYF